MASPTRLSRAVPAVRFRPPERQPGGVRRRRVSDALIEAERGRNLSVVSAPSGYGKTTAAAEWASGVDGIAWLALSASDAAPGVLTQGVIDALLVGGDRAGRPLALTPGLIDPARAYAEICDALDGVDHLVHLVVDDAQRAGEHWRQGLLGLLAEQSPDNLHLMLVGTTLLDITLSREHLMDPGAFVGPETLRFTQSEIEQIDGVGATGIDAETVLRETHGWPIAVRLVAIGGARPSSDAATASAFLGDYVRDHVLSTLPRETVEFVLDATICHELTPELASAVTERADAGSLLDECVRLGLFLDRFEGPHGVVYRWHASFARQCVEIARKDPQRSAERHRWVARFLQTTEPLVSVAHSLRAHEPTRARQLPGRLVGDQISHQPHAARGVLRRRGPRGRGHGRCGPVEARAGAPRLRPDVGRPFHGRLDHSRRDRCAGTCAVGCRRIRRGEYRGGGGPRRLLGRRDRRRRAALRDRARQQRA